MATESSISSAPVINVASLVVSGGQKVNRSLEALCNAANSELRNIGQCETNSLTSIRQELASPQVFAARAIVPLIASNGALSWNIVGGLTPAKTLTDNSDGILPQLFPVIQGSAVALGNPYQVSQCFVPGNPSSSNHLPMTTNFLGPQPRGLSIVGNSPQLIVRLPVSIESKPSMVNGEDHLAVSSATNVVSSEQQQKTPNDSETRAGRHVCEFCERRFAKPSVLVKHLRTHTGERPYPCTTCGLSFKTKSNLYKHRKSRTHQHTLNVKNTSSADPSMIHDTEATVGLISSTNACYPSVIESPFSQPGLFKAEVESSTDLMVGDLVTTVADMVAGNGPELSSMTREVVEAIVSQPSIPATSIACTARVTDHIDISANAETVAEQFTDHALSDSVLSSVSSTVTIAVGEKSDMQNVTTEALQDRISRLISQNASIINMPMTKAPRGKRILRQSSDVVCSNQAARSVVGKTLLRAQSLNPSEIISSSELTEKVMECELAMPNRVLNSGSLLTVQLPEVRVPKEVLTKPQYLAVLGDVDSETNYESKVCIETSETDSEHLPSVNSNNVQIVLQLCEGIANPSSGVSVSPEILYSTSCKVSDSSTACEPVQPDRYSDISTSATTIKSLSITSNALPSLQLFKPFMNCSSASSCGLPLQYIHPPPLIGTAPFQYVVVSGNSSAGSMKFASMGSAEKPITASSGISTTVFALNNLPPRRGRPKGSKNRPKLSASASDPQTRVLPVSTPTLDSSVVVTSSSALWKLKLKNQLLMRRSLSYEKSCWNRQSVSCEEVAETTSASEVALPSSSQLPCSVSLSLPSHQSNKNTAGLDGSTLTSVCSNNTVISEDLASNSVTLSMSCDSSIPLKKRRKTLTELGKGTTFGTRVEDTSMHSDAVINGGSVLQCLLDAELGVNSLDTTSQILSDVLPDAHVITLGMVDGFNGNAVESTSQMTKVTGELTPLDCSFKNVIAPPGTQSSDLDRVESRLQISQHNGAEDQVSRNGLSVTQMICSTVKSSSVASVQPFSSRIISQSMTALSPQKISTSSIDVEVLTANECATQPQCVGHSLETLDNEPAATKTSGSLLLLGHSYPSLILGAKPTFCSALRPQPFCATTCGSTGSTLSMYDNWHNVSTPLENNSKSSSGKLSTETFASYRTVRRGEDTSYAAACCADDKKRSGILTHSSYWNYRKDKISIDDLEADSVRCDSLAKSIEEPCEAEPLLTNLSPDVDVLNDSLASCSLVMNNRSTDVEKSAGKYPRLKIPFISSSKLRFVARKLQPMELTGKKTWVCPGGYRSVESYVYVRGRGRGSYVCATCGIRCKKPSILRKHLHLHTDLRPYHCRVCDVGFKTKGNLNKHLNSKFHMRSFGTSSNAVVETLSFASQSDKCEPCDADPAIRPDPLQTGDELETDSGCELHHSSSFEVDLDGVRDSSIVRSEEIVDWKEADTQKTPNNHRERPSSSESRQTSSESLSLRLHDGKLDTSRPIVVNAPSSDTLDLHLHSKHAQATASVFARSNVVTQERAEVGLILSGISEHKCRNADGQVAMLPSQVLASDVGDLSVKSGMSTGVNRSNVEPVQQCNASVATQVGGESVTVEDSNTAVSGRDVVAVLAVTSARVKPSMTKRCEIFPVPGRVSTEGVRVGTSYACPTCRKQFSSAPRLALHRNIHFFERPVRCPICRASFTSRSMAERHRLAEHAPVDPSQREAGNNPRPYRCDECGIAFRILGHLAKHRRSKSHAARVVGLPGMPHSDEICVDTDVNIASEGVVEVQELPNTDSARVRGLNDGLDDGGGEDSSEKTVDAPGSDQLLAGESSAPSHVSVVSEHTCDICGETLADIATFKKHLTSHIERRPFICEHCDAGFTSAKLLAEHKKIHTQACAHVCGMCGNRSDDTASTPAPDDATS